jgi:hypothetical protein
MYRDHLFSQGLRVDGKSTLKRLPLKGLMNHMPGGGIKSMLIKNLGFLKFKFKQGVNKK